MQVYRIDPFAQSGIVRDIANVYRQSFGGEPWNEGYVCPLCQKEFPLIGTTATCLACAEKSQEVLLVERWPVGKVISDFYGEMQRPQAICVVAEEYGMTIGFAWGYRVTIDSDLSSYLDAPNLDQLIQGDFFYLDECAIIPDHQGRGIGKMLVDCVFHEQHDDQVILRTMDHSRMHSIISHLGGEVVQKISRDRIIMRLNLSVGAVV